MGKGFQFRATAGLTVVLLAYLADGFYLPGLLPVWYCKNPNSRSPWQEFEPSSGCHADMPIFVNSLNSLQTLLPFEYSSFDFCSNPNKGEQGPVENLGQVLLGDRIEPSPYKLTFLKDETCVEVCTRHYNRGTADQDGKLKFLIRGIRLNYQHHWIIDNVPITWCYTVEGGYLYCSTGFPIGCYVDIKGVQKDACVISLKLSQKDTYYVFNHVDILITYNNASYQGYDVGRLLSAKIQLRSLKEVNAEETGCGINSSPLGINLRDHEHNITYSYSVRFVVNNDIRWTSRWDYLLEQSHHNNIQWFSIGNSLVTVLFLSGMIALIMIRVLRKDLAIHDKTAAEETRKVVELLQGDVFRAPGKQMLLSVLVGNGIQLFFMALLTLFFASLGFLSPANKGVLVTWSLELYVCLGIPAGYVSARIYKSFNGEKWGLNVLLTAVLCPGVVFLIFSMMNLILWIKRSSAAIPVTAHLKLLALWFGISLPLTFVGAYFGFKKKIIEHPVIPNEIPRLIPDRPHYKKPLVGIMLGGLLSLSCIFFQLNPILNSIWTNQIYDMYGFLFLEFIILVVTCSETTILLLYFHLSADDYRWRWRSYLTSGSTAVYFVIYCIHYYMSKSEIHGAVSVFLYFGYTFIMAFLLFLLTGSVGFCGCFWFVSKIYRDGNYQRVS